MSLKPFLVVLTAFLIAPLCLCFSQSAHSLRQRIPKPDSTKYQAIRDARDWKNPILIVQPDGVEIVGVNDGHPIEVDSVGKALEALPTSAWPYGLVVAVQDQGIALINQAHRIPPNRVKLLRLLRKLNVATVLWPTN